MKYFFDFVKINYLFMNNENVGKFSRLIIEDSKWWIKYFWYYLPLLWAYEWALTSEMKIKWNSKESSHVHLQNIFELKFVGKESVKNFLNKVAFLNENGAAWLLDEIG